MWRFNRRVNRLSDSTFVIRCPLISANWMYIVGEGSYSSNLPLNRQISARCLIRPFLYILGSLQSRSKLLSNSLSIKATAEPPSSPELAHKFEISSPERRLQGQNEMALLAVDLARSNKLCRSLSWGTLELEKRPVRPSYEMFLGLGSVGNSPKWLFSSPDRWPVLKLVLSKPTVLRPCMTFMWPSTRMEVVAYGCPLWHHKEIKTFNCTKED